MTILPGLTTTDPSLASQFLSDLKTFPERKIALFPTCLGPSERQDLYKDLEKIPGLSIPHVHIRTDMDLGELEYLEQRFNTEVFNIHPQRSSHPFTIDAPGLKKKIFIENSGTVPEADELEEFGGLCLDYSHWENGVIQQDPEYGRMADLLERYPVGCCHLSAIMRDKKSPWGGTTTTISGRWKIWCTWGSTRPICLPGG